MILFVSTLIKKSDGSARFVPDTSDVLFEGETAVECYFEIVQGRCWFDGDLWQVQYRVTFLALFVGKYTVLCLGGV